jgi:hypothetical protein
MNGAQDLHTVSNTKADRFAPQQYLKVIELYDNRGKQLYIIDNYQGIGNNLYTLFARNVSTDELR